jgi:hypothetical protein
MSETLQTVFYTTGIIALIGLTAAVGYVVLRDIQSNKQPIIQNQKENKEIKSNTKINTGIQVKKGVQGNVVQNNKGDVDIKTNQQTWT